MVSIRHRYWRCLPPPMHSPSVGAASQSDFRRWRRAANAGVAPPGSRETNMLSDTVLLATEPETGLDDQMSVPGELRARERADRAHVQPRAERMQTLRNLACGIAHDLGNVLTPILLGIEALKAELVSD